MFLMRRPNDCIELSSKRAREERALAAERRLLALQGQPTGVAPTLSLLLFTQGYSASTSKLELPIDDMLQFSDDDFSDVEDEIVPETDADRRRTLLSSEQEPDISNLKSGSIWEGSQNDFKFGVSSQTDNVSKNLSDVIEILSDEDDGDCGCDLPVASGSTFTSAPKPPRQGSLKKEASRAMVPVVDKGMRCVHCNHPIAIVMMFPPARPTIPTIPKSTGTLGLGKMVQSEIKLRKQESLGMAPVKGGGRTLGGSGPIKPLHPSPAPAPEQQHKTDQEWSCVVCTL